MEAPELERRLVAILAADVEGYSRLMRDDEETTMATLSSRRLLIDNLISQYRGRIANTAGDSVLAEFVSVLDAVTCALEIQKAMAEANEATPDRPMRLRIGVNAGDIMVKEGDIFGDGVNVAARLEGLVKGNLVIQRKRLLQMKPSRAEPSDEHQGSTNIEVALNEPLCIITLAACFGGHRER